MAHVCQKLIGKHCASIHLCPPRKSTAKAKKKEWTSRLALEFPLLRLVLLPAANKSSSRGRTSLPAPISASPAPSLLSTPLEPALDTLETHPWTTCRDASPSVTHSVPSPNHHLLCRFRSASAREPRHALPQSFPRVQTAPCSGASCGGGGAGASTEAPQSQS